MTAPAPAPAPARQRELFDVAGKVALVTGGSRGIGRHMAGGLVQAGARVYITSRNAAAAASSAAELAALGACVALPANLSDLGGVCALASEIGSREGALDILVNNAGATWGAPIESFPESGWDKVMDLNVKAVFFLTQQLLPALRAAGRPEDPARVINVGSIGGLRPSRGAFSYQASKAAVHHLTRALALRLAAEHINVNAIAPGPFHTKMMDAALGDPASRREIEAGIPMGRIGGPEDLAGLAIFLSARASAYITGAVIALDGGASMGR